MSSGMENLATGEGPVKREREEIKAVNNQATRCRGRSSTARARTATLSDSQFPVCASPRRASTPPPPPRRARSVARPPAHLACISRARTAREPARSSSRASTVNPTPSVARLTTPAPPPPPFPDDSPLNPSEYNWEAHYPEFFAKAKEADPNAEAPLVRFADVGWGSADCSFDCRRCFRTISPWVRLGFPSSRSNELVSAWRVVPDSPSRARRRAR